MGRLTTHVLDLASGRPAAGVRIEVYRLDGDEQRMAATTTNDDGRADAPLLEGADLTAGTYELRFAAGDYRRAQGATRTPFYDIVPVRFTVADADAHYHIPLLLAPHGYSTYRGS